MGQPELSSGINHPPPNNDNNYAPTLLLVIGIPTHSYNDIASYTYSLSFSHFFYLRLKCINLQML